jgi:hypothetical protein
MHPPPPWAGPRGRRTLVPARADAFAPLLARYGSPEDADTAHSLITAIIEHREPEAFSCFENRRSRAKARIVLRQLAARGGSPLVEKWRRIHDRGGVSLTDASSWREEELCRPRLPESRPPETLSAELFAALLEARLQAERHAHVG